MLLNLTLTSPVAEAEFVTLAGAIVDANPGDVLTLTIDWGDGSAPEAFAYTNALNLFTNFHQYLDDAPAGAPADQYTVRLTLADQQGAGVATNVVVAVTNVAPAFWELSLNAPLDLVNGAAQVGLTVTEFDLPTADSAPNVITVGPDGALWFSESGANRIGRITTNGVITEFPVPGATNIQGITTGPDGALWFAAHGNSRIGRLTTGGAVTLFTTNGLLFPLYLTRGPDPAVWFSTLAGHLGRVTTNGTITLHSVNGTPYGLVTGPDNALWFADFWNDRIGRWTLAGALTYYPLPSFSGPLQITRGPDHALWFTEFQAGYLGRITTNGSFSEELVARHLPQGITAGPDGTIWFTEFLWNSNCIVRRTPDGDLTRIRLAALSQPADIVTGPDGALWFTEFSRNKIGRVGYTAPGNVLLTGTIADPATADRHTLIVDWGDGSPPQTNQFGPGVIAVSLTHDFACTNAYYTVRLILQDDDAGSSERSVVVNPVRLLQVTRLAGGEARIEGVGCPGRTYALEAADELPGWNPAGGATADGSGAFQFTDAGAVGRLQRFYRVALGP